MSKEMSFAGQPPDGYDPRVDRLPDRVLRLETRMDNLTDNFATKEDLSEVYRKLDSKLEATRADFNKAFGEMDTKFEKRFGEMDTKFEKRFGEMDTKMEKGFGELRTEIKAIVQSPAVWWAWLGCHHVHWLGRTDLFQSKQHDCRVGPDGPTL